MKTLLSAHRGGAALAPENTLASFRKGLTFSPDSLEFDVHLTKDGVPVVIHDAVIDRTTDGTGRVGSYTVAELQTFNAAGKFPGGGYDRQFIPTLAQVLDLVRNEPVGVDIEVKTPPDGARYTGIVQKVLDEIAAHGMLDRVRIMGFEFDHIVQSKAIQPRVPTVALISMGFLGSKDAYQPATAIAHILTMGANAIGINKDLLTPAMVEEAHRQHLFVGVWTADSEDEMRRLIALGVDGLTTNRPDLLRRVLDS